jgi:hypothetical protein
MNYEDVMAKARATNKKRDASERKNGMTPESEQHPFVQIRTAMLAIQAGITTEDWGTVAEGQAILEAAMNTIREKTGQKW